MLLPEVIGYVRRHRLLNPGDRVAAAVSGGADSVALLRWLLHARAELGIVLSVAHFNHGIRGDESEGDQQFVRDLANTYDLPLHCEGADVPAFACQNKLSLETAARQLRYAFLRRLMQSGVVNKVATAHTCDDQAESVLMRVIRGTGSRGLAGIYPRHDEGESGAIIRPLLEIRRDQVESFLQELGQPWREDSSNRDVHHTRNRVRHELLPLIARHYNPAIVHTLAAQAEIARGEETYWQAEVLRLWPGVVSGDSPGSITCNIAAMGGQRMAVQRRLVRAIAERLGIHLDFEHVERVLALISGTDGTAPSVETGKICVLPGGWRARRTPHEICFEPAAAGGLPQKIFPQNYRYLLPVPGEVHVPELGSTFHARWQPWTTALSASSAPRQVITGDELVVRNWVPGDRFQPGKAKSPKKMKELLQRRALHGPEKHFWPVVSHGDHILWTRGFSMPQIGRAGSAQVLIIEELSPESGNQR